MLYYYYLVTISLRKNLKHYVWSCSGVVIRISIIIAKET